MDDRPIIIIGGGLWGSLLALKLSETLPDVKFELYEAGSTLGGGLTLSFHQQDLYASDFEWIKPFISHLWQKHQVAFPKYRKWLEETFCTIHSAHLHERLTETLKHQKIFLNHEISIEEALYRGSFVIDTRFNGYFKAQGYQKSQGLLVELESFHHLQAPLTMDAKVEQENGFRYLQYLPLEKDKLFIRETRFSTDPGLYHEDFTVSLIEHLSSKGWNVREVISREENFRKVPLKEFIPVNEGRILRLEGFLHDTTGEILPDALRIIGRMVQTSFRLGELKAVLRSYVEERERHRKVFRLINKILYQTKSPCSERYQLFQFLYQLPAALRARFHSGDMDYRDMLRMLLARPSFKFWRQLATVSPEPAEA